MKALTIWQPWAWAIIHAGKDIENRNWPAWPRLIGERIAIHAGKRLDKDAAEWMRRSSHMIGCEIPDRFARGFIVGTAVLSAVHAPLSDECASPWWAGDTYGWELSDVIATRKPVLCKGMQGFWTVPDDVLLRMDPK